jgi:hypothetical protein
MELHGFKGFGRARVGLSFRDSLESYSMQAMLR